MREMKIAGGYVRKSTDQKVADESKSTTRQLENIKAYAALNGLKLDERYIFVDDGISGAEFEKRPGLSQMRALLKRGRAPFQVLIVSELKSLGREMTETSYLLKQLDEAGVDVREYVHGKSLVPKTHTDKLVSVVEAFSAEDHQRKTSERVTEKFMAMTRKGYVTGGRIYGYRNVDIFSGLDAHGRPLKSHVEREIVPAEATVVRQMFEWYASGLGLKAIAKKANQMGLLAPKPFIRKSDKIPTPIGKWAPSTIRTILRREIYKGVLVYNKTKKRSDWGKVDPKDRPESEWVRTPVEPLRIVSDKLWDRCADRRKDVEGRAVRFEGGRMSGRPPKGEAKNLLAGLATCAMCGGGIVVESNSRKKGRVAEYVCHRRRFYGTCENRVHLPVDMVNERILSAIEEHALTPEAIEQVIRLSERDDVREKQEALRREQADCARRIDRLVTVIAEGADAPTALLGKLRELEARQKALDTEIRCLRPVPRLAPQVVEGRLAEWRRLLRQSVTQGRAVLQRVLRGRIVFTPREGGYDFNCETRYDRLFSGVAVERPSWIPEAGHGFTSEDTWDGDYGRLLETQQTDHVKGMASPTGFEPVF